MLGLVLSVEDGTAIDEIKEEKRSKTVSGGISSMREERWRKKETRQERKEKGG